MNSKKFSVPLPLCKTRSQSISTNLRFWTKNLPLARPMTKKNCIRVKKVYRRRCWPLTQICKAGWSRIRNRTKGNNNLTAIIIKVKKAQQWHHCLWNNLRSLKISSGLVGTECRILSMPSMTFKRIGRSKQTHCEDHNLTRALNLLSIQSWILKKEGNRPIFIWLTSSCLN